MKLGIISINSHTKVLNPASPLHSYVFQQFLKKNGYDSTIIDYKPVYYGSSDVAVREPLLWRAQRPGEDLKKHAEDLRRWSLLYEDRKVRFDKFKEFVDTHYVQTDKCYNSKLLDEEDPGFDCYLCVTDIIWKDNPVNGFDKGYTLASKCMDGKKKIAYTASRGAQKYHPEREQMLLERVADFDFISVRETSFKEYLEELLDKEVPVLCDPIFLMGKDFYEDLAKQPDYVPEKDFVVIYLAMNQNNKLVKLASDYAEKHGLELIELSEYPDDANIPEGTHHKVIYDIGPDEWLWYLFHSKINFTNSFHGRPGHRLRRRRPEAGGLREGGRRLRPERARVPRDPRPQTAPHRRGTGGTVEGAVRPPGGGAHRRGGTHPGHRRGEGPQGSGTAGCHRGRGAETQNEDPPRTGPHPPSPHPVPRKHINRKETDLKLGTRMRSVFLFRIICSGRFTAP